MEYSKGLTKEGSGNGSSSGTSGLGDGWMGVKVKSHSEGGLSFCLFLRPAPRAFSL